MDRRESDTTEQLTYPHNLSVYPEKNIIQKDTCTLMFVAVLLTIAKTWEYPKCPLTDEWIKKICLFYPIINGILQQNITQS